VFDDSVIDDDAKDKGREQSFAEPEVDDVLDTVCTTCQGTRLNAQARAVRLGQFSALVALDKSSKADKMSNPINWAITDIASLSVTDVRAWVDQLQLTGRDAEIARDLVPEIKSRLEFLEDVGLGYLTLDRGAPTLSGGEAQRIRLAAQLGSNLQGVCYVLDEPTIGLHPRDNRILLDTLAQPYILMAEAKGMPRGVLLFRHALRPALIPVLTSSSLVAGGLLGGAAVIETVFAWPGIGRYMIEAIAGRACAGSTFGSPSREVAIRR
jgi:hypothetical protein